MSQDYYISLGAGINQKPLILAAKEKGLRVIGVDQNLDAEAMANCDLKVEESILNYRKIHHKIMMLMLDSEIAGGYSASFGQALLSWAFVAERYNLIGLSRTQIEFLSDKYLVRKKLKKKAIREQGLLQPAFLGLEQSLLKKDIEALNYPIIIKPRSGYAKNNIFLAENYADVKELLKVKQLKSRGLLPREMILEEYIDGDEVTMVGLVESFKYLPILLTDKVTSTQPPFIELEHRFPSKYMDKYESLIKLNQLLVDVLQIPSAPLVSEWKFRNNNWYLIEVSPQIPGEYLSTFIIPNTIRYDYYANLVNLTIGQPVVPALTKYKKGARIQYFESRMSIDNWNGLKEKSHFAKILNQNPQRPAMSNMDRFGVMGFLER